MPPHRPRLGRLRFQSGSLWLLFPWLTFLACTPPLVSHQPDANWLHYCFQQCLGAEIAPESDLSKARPIGKGRCWQSLKTVLPSLILPRSGWKLCAMEEELGVGELSLHQPPLLDPHYGAGAIRKGVTGATPAASVTWYWLLITRRRAEWGLPMGTWAAYLLWAQHSTPAAQSVGGECCTIHHFSTWSSLQSRSWSRRQVPPPPGIAPL